MSILPYQTTHIAISNRYRFSTEAGHAYEVYFDLKSGVLPDEDLDDYTMYIGFTCVPEFIPFENDYDARTGETIMWLIANTFRDYKRAILVYVCSPKDKYARHRSIAFRRWHNESPLKEKITLLTKENNRTYYGALFNKKHPDAEKAEFVFDTYNPKHKFEPVEELLKALEEEDDDEIPFDFEDNDFL